MVKEVEVKSTRRTIHRGAAILLRTIAFAGTALLAVALTIASAPLGAQEGATRLRYTPPEGWTPSLDGKALQAPGGGAGVTFLASTPFAGTAEQWLEASWNGILRELKLVSVPAPGVQGPFLTRLGLFQQADGSKVWLSLITIVRDGRGEGVVYFATGEAQFQANLGGLSRMLVGIANPPPPGAPPSPRAAQPPGVAPPALADPPGPAIAGGGDVAGLYLASTSQFRLNPLGSPGSGSWEWRTEFYLLSRDGHVFRGPDLPRAPGGDINRFDFNAARREAPDASGTYVVRGREVVLSMGVPVKETIVATRPEPDVLLIRQTKYRRGAASPSGAPPAAAPVAPPAPPAAAPRPSTITVPAAPTRPGMLPRLAYRAPDGFRATIDGNHVAEGTAAFGYVRIHDFRTYGGDFEGDFRRTLLRDWLDADEREDRVLGAPEINATAVPGAEQALTAVFRQPFHGLPTAIGANWDLPRVRMRVAVLAGGAVAIIDLNLRDDAAWHDRQVALAAFLDSLRVALGSP